MGECRRAGESCALLHSFAGPVFFPFDRRDAEYILRRGGNFKKARIFDTLATIFGKMGLFTQRDDATHSVHRKALTSAFASDALRVAFDSVITGCALDLVDRVAEIVRPAPCGGEPRAAVDLEPLVNAYALKVILAAAFGSLGTCDKANVEFRRMITAFGNAKQMFIPGGRWILTKAMRDFLASASAVRRLCVAAVEDAKSHETSDDTRRKLLVDYIADSRRSGLFNDEAVADHIVTFLLAGHETTTTHVMWALYLLAKHPHVQRELLEELEAAVTIDQMPSLDTLHALTLLNNVHKEALRLYPPAVGIVREAAVNEFLPFSQVFVPKGAEVFVSVFCMQRDPAIWGDDALEFRPSRFDDRAFIDEHVGMGGYLPFSHGKRNCIGKDLAQDESLMAIAVVVRRFRLALPANTPAQVALSQRLTLRPRDPVLLEIYPRAPPSTRTGK